MSRLTQIPPSTLYHLFLFFDVEKKNKYTHPSMTHTPMFLSNLTKLSGLNKKYQKSRISIFNELPDTEMIAKML